MSLGSSKNLQHPPIVDTPQNRCGSAWCTWGSPLNLIYIYIYFEERENKESRTYVQLWMLWHFSQFTRGQTYDAFLLSTTASLVHNVLVASPGGCRSGKVEMGPLLGTGSSWCHRWLIFVELSSHASCSREHVLIRMITIFKIFKSMAWHQYGEMLHMNQG